jgi:CRISPR-associated endoribonuclease Cas6
MPTSTILFLTPPEEVTLPATMGHLAHAAFLELVRQADPDLSQRLHDQPRNVPFTCSRLIRGRRERRGEKGPVEASSSVLRFPANRWCWLRYTLLDDALFEVFTRRFLEQGEMSLRLGAGTFQVWQMTTLQDADDEDAWSLWAGYSPYEEIWELAEPQRLWAFHFASPTAFRARETSSTRKTAPSVTFPEPRRCFQSWLSRWNEFSPFPFERDRLLDFVAEHVLVTEHRLQTRMMQFPHTKMAGFVGEVIFEVDGPAEEEMLRQLDALAHFSFYSGTGYGTPKGMGQTRRAADKEILARIRQRETPEGHP